MTLLDFDSQELAASAPVQVRTSPIIQETVKVTPARSEARAFLAKPDGSWGWEDLRDYVVFQIEEKFGPFPRNFFKEQATFKRFMETWGEKASQIAKYAFEDCDGWWSSAPISVNRFTKGSDPFFAQVIAERLS